MEPDSAANANKGTTSGLAIGSLICGIFALPSCGLAGIAGAILGHLGLSEIRKSSGAKRGRGLAVAGLVLSYLSLAILPIATLSGLAAPMILRQKKEADRAMTINNMKLLGLALLEFDQEYGSFPSDATAAKVARSTGQSGPMTGPDVLRQLEAFGPNGSVTEWLTVTRLAEGDWLYHAGLDTHSAPSSVLLVSPVLEDKVIVLRVDNSVHTIPRQQVEVLVSADESFVVIPAPRR